MVFYKRWLMQGASYIVKLATEYGRETSSHKPSKDPVKKPVAGRRTEPTTNMVQFDTGNQLQKLEPDFAIQWLDTIEYLAAWHQDVSLGVDNIVQLGNTPHKIKFADSVNDKQQKDIMVWLTVNRKKWYAYSGGINSLINDLFSQVVITGAVSTENVPNRRLDNLHQVWRVHPKSIRFVYDPKKDVFLPYQVTTKPTVNENQALTGLKPLNPKTYQYIANRRHGESPYATPPFLAAIESLVTQRWMMDNFKQVMKMLGMMGFVALNVEPPEREQGQSDTDYWAKCVEYLDSVAPQLEKTISAGYAIGYKGTHEWTLQGSTMNVEGAKGLYELIIHMLAAGLKQDPNLLGWNFSTTETFGNVIMKKMTSQVENYQGTVAAALEEIYRLALLLGGFDPDAIKDVVFDAPMIGDEKKKQETRGLEIGNVIKLREKNIIDDQMAANMLGFDKPAGKWPEPEVGVVPPPGKVPPGKKPAKPKDKTKLAVLNITAPQVVMPYMIEQAVYGLKGYAPQFQYAVPMCSHTHQEHEQLSRPRAGDFHDQRITRFINGYIKDVHHLYNEAIDSVAQDIGRDLFSLPKDTQQQVVLDRTLFYLYKSWSNLFVTPVKAIAQKHTENIYTEYRHDTSVFGPDNEFARQQFDFEIPDAVFDLFDFRALDYLAEYDGLYLGKFITDPDVRNKVTKFINDAYLAGDTPLGSNSIGLDKFREEFKKTVNLAAWKIRRILETTVSKIRNYAGLNYMSQAQVENFEVVEVMDHLTCGWCRHMNGKTFVVRTAKERVNQVINGRPEEVAELSPFATGIKLEKFVTMDAEELQSAGFDTPIFHPHCRGRNIATGIT